MKKRIVEMRVRPDIPLRLPGPVRHAGQGQVMILFALASLVLIGFVALSIDTGFLMSERRQTQNAADAAALAAAKSLFDGKSGQMVAAAKAYGADNADVSQDNVTVSWPPASGEHAGDNQYVQVTVTKDVEKFFVGALYTGDWKVSASAVAGIEPQGANYALITLDRTHNPGIYMNGTTTIRLIGDHASAYGSTDVDGNGKLYVDGAVDSHGSVSGVGSAPDGIHTNMPYIPDPLDGVPAPSKPATVRTGCTGDCDLQPGYYKNQTILCKWVCNFAPGLYYFENTSVKSQSTKSEMNGPGGVMFYFTGSSEFDSKNGGVNLRAPAASPYAGGQEGVVFWSASCNEINFQGNGDFYMHGIVYAPCADVSMNGTPGGDGVKGQWIVNTFKVVGTSDFRLNYHSYVDTKRPKIFLVG
ncbi:MAG TPA: pilus assembly protein TadG-related protein [Thermomicrobiales bacterium]|nr:pilus assembly protein TadG-related protein [Thermomicrobiales bacterium]